MITKEQKETLWKNSKPAKEYFEDWLVIPVLDVIAILNTPIKETKKQNFSKVQRAYGLSRKMDLTIEEAKQQLENTDGDCNCKGCQNAKKILDSESNENTQKTVNKNSPSLIKTQEEKK